MSYRRTLQVSDQAIKGVVLFSPTTTPVRGELSVRIESGGKLVAIGEGVRQLYRGEAMRLSVPLKPFSLPDGSEITLIVERVHGEPLALHAGIESGALSLSLLHPVVIDEATRYGVAAGGAVLLAVALVTVLPRRQWLAASCLAVAAVPLGLIGFLYIPGELGISDWDYYFTVHSRYRDSLVLWHTFPFWNAYTCGGTAGLADPEFPIFSPLYPLELLFGVSRGLRTAAVASVAVGAVGMIVLARRLAFSVEAALLAALVFSFSTPTLLKLVEGHIDMFAAMWISWILWAWLGAYRARHTDDGRRRTVLCGIFLALSFLQGGIHILLYLVPALVALGLLVADKKWGLLTSWWAGLWSAGLVAVKFFPAVLWTRQFPDRAYALSTNTLPWLHEIFFGRHLHGDEVLPYQGGGWHEYGAYVGPVVVALAVLGLARWHTSRLVRTLALGVGLSVLLSSLGPALAPLFDLVPWLPRSYTSRVIVLTVPALALLAGLGLDMLARWRPAHKVRLLQVVLVGVVAIDLLSLSYPLALEAFVVPGVSEPLPPAPAPLAFTSETHKVRVRGVEYDRAYEVGRQGYGTLTYCSVLTPPIAVTAAGEEDNAYVRLDGGSGKVRLTQWSPGRMVVDVVAGSDALVVLNANYAEGWRAN
jgi:hypothetical protein